jgi:hypothetical protein
MTEVVIIKTKQGLANKCFKRTQVKYWALKSHRLDQDIRLRPYNNTTEHHIFT